MAKKEIEQFTINLVKESQDALKLVQDLNDIINLLKGNILTKNIVIEVKCL